MSPIKKIFIVLLLCISPGCGGGGGGDESSPFEVENPIVFEGNSFTFSTNSDEDGKASMIFNVPEGANVASVTAESPGGVVRFDRLGRSDGTNFLDPGGEFLTTSLSIFRDSSAVNLPSRGQDSSISAGDSILAEVSVGSGAATSFIDSAVNTPVIFNIRTKGDGNFGGGSLAVNIFLVGSMAQGESRGAIDSAAQRMTSILGSTAGISVSLSIKSVSGPAILPNPIEGSSFYLNNIQNSRTPAANIFVGSDIAELFDAPGSILGLSGGIPGAPIPTRRSLVAISLLASAGIDGTFSNAEISLLGETFAHEVAHYLGLFHPFDITEDGSVVGFDPLGDTNTCDSESACLADPSLFRNLMFSFPVIDEAGNLVPQEQLSGQQAEVLNRNILVN